MKLKEIFNDKNLFEKALTHSSYAHHEGQESNEKLEFMGDRVVNIIIATIIYNKFNNLSVGEMAVAHSHYASTNFLALIAKHLGLDEVLKLDQGETQRGGRKNPRNLEDLTEAFFGALYLDRGFEFTLNFGLENFSNLMDSDIKLSKDTKSTLQEYVQKKGFDVPVYEVTSQVGPSHEPHFEIKVIVNGIGEATGSGNNKKIAQVEAANNLLKKLGII